MAHPSGVAREGMTKWGAGLPDGDCRGVASLPARGVRAVVEQLASRIVRPSSCGRCLQSEAGQPRLRRFHATMPESRRPARRLAAASRWSPPIGLAMVGCWQDGMATAAAGREHWLVEPGAIPRPIALGSILSRVVRLARRLTTEGLTCSIWPTCSTPPREESRCWCTSPRRPGRGC
jgi:hypothetical protein